MAVSTMYPPQKDSPSTVLQGDILASDTTFLVLNAAILPQTVPFPLTLGFDTFITEVVMVTDINSVTNQLTVTRTDGRIWPAGTKVARVFNADDLLVVQNNISELVQITNYDKLIEWTNGENYDVTSISIDSDNVLTSATVKWPDGSTGTLTVTTKNTTWLAVDAFTITHVNSGKTVTQSAVTRSSTNGQITNKPALTVA